MDAHAIDHANLHIPSDGIETALEFYRDALGFHIERLDQFHAGETPFFAVRVTPKSAIHLWPDPDFEPPSGEGYDHLAIHLAESLGAIRETVQTAEITIEDERSVLGAAGEATSIYVRDPFGYLLELKADHA